MDVFALRHRLIDEYGKFVRSFIEIGDPRIAAFVEREFREGVFWPDPLLQLNPSFEPGETIDELVRADVLHEECARIFRIKSEARDLGKVLRLHRHQSEAIRVARKSANYVLTTGTGSGKSLAYIVPIVDRVLREGAGRGIQAIVVYPMNALANSQLNELEKFLGYGYPDGKGPVSFARYTGQESNEEKQTILGAPPDILLTNYVMLELLLTRIAERPLVQAAQGLRFLVLDELHTYRGRQGADVAMLVRRAREAFAAPELQCVGTSATLAGSGSSDEQRQEVARVASLLFGAPVQPEHVIGETLRRITHEHDAADPAFISSLRGRLEQNGAPPKTFSEYVRDPLSSWIESTFGLMKETGSTRLVRVTPRSLSGERGAAGELSLLVGVDESRCAATIQRQLLGSYACERNPETGFPIFAFRLHQFISRGDTVYASLESTEERHLTLRQQQFVPGDRGRLLFPLSFCRECGQEYYNVFHKRDLERGPHFIAKNPGDNEPIDGAIEGYLYLNPENPWPEELEAIKDRVPEDWLEAHKGGLRIRSERRDRLPRALHVVPDGRITDEGLDAVWVPAPFAFCLNCLAAYGVRQRSDYSKLGFLATEGRSSATTVLCLAAIRELQRTEELSPRARKLLSFTDNRQDASLQAGHFNDFVEIGLLRSALYRAAVDSKPDGIPHEGLVYRVFEALNLPFEQYANDPAVQFRGREDAKRALKQVLGYRLYRDLKQGWRITLPNLQQCGLLEIRYPSLDELCAAEEMWQGLHPALVTASPETRSKVARTLLDFMRRELAVKVDYLKADYQDQIQQLSSQHLKAPWALDEGEQGGGAALERATVLFPRPSQGGGDDNLYLSSRSLYGLYLRWPRTFPDYSTLMKPAEAQDVICQLLRTLRKAGLVEPVVQPRDSNDVPGYQVPAAAMIWVAGDGSRPYRDPLRMHRVAKEGGRANPFFVEFYQGNAAEMLGVEAREHTAQVRYEDRQEREKRFRSAELPLLFCSPTMELGVDIAELNVVNMRNVPPTPANYAQRSGRAGRSGQPALVFTYCSSFSSHDQYFFRRPTDMVAGAVTPPRIDLANEDLIRAHVNAVWLAEARVDLRTTLAEILDLEDPNRLPIRDALRADIESPDPRTRARGKIQRIVATIQGEIAAVEWYGEGWIDEVMTQLPLAFDAACNRWRDLYRGAFRQQEVNNRIIVDHARTAQEKAQARALRAESEAQMKLLIEPQRVTDGDFYSYRYFASEGFLPGYNFPRLPLSAYIPGRRARAEDFVSRPRFLAISEFGPRSILYHEGVRYRIHKAILPPREADNQVATSAIKQCDECGYFHECRPDGGPDLCGHCHALLPAPMTSLLRLQNVATRRADRISSDEEERQRLGYELRTGVRFADREGRVSSRHGRAVEGGDALLELAYGHAASISRVNLGWAKRKNRNQLGFVLDLDNGYWGKEKDLDDADPGDPMGRHVQHVIPFVEDRKNSLLIRPVIALGDEEMASLQAALKQAIQVEFQLEEAEIAAEPLPRRDRRNRILIFEAAEGGAGVLRRLFDDPRTLAGVARRALEICHFDPDTGEDQKRAPRAREDCEAACYDCLMSYGNQWDHELLDRRRIKDLLLRLSRATVEVSSTSVPRATQLDQLLLRCESELEKRWIRFVDKHGLRLPTHGQRPIDACRVRPDFFYAEHLTVIYIDGPPHDHPERQERDRAQQTCLEDLGYTVVRFHHEDNWREIVAAHPSLFGKLA